MAKQCGCWGAMYCIVCLPGVVRHEQALQREAKAQRAQLRARVAVACEYCGRFCHGLCVRCKRRAAELRADTSDVDTVTRAYWERERETILAMEGY